MFYWKHLDIDNDALLEIQDRARSCLPKNTEFFQPLKIKQLSFLNLPVFACILIQVWPRVTGGIHIDYRPKDDKTEFQLALNIPIENCEDSVTNMYRTKVVPGLSRLSEIHRFRSFNPEDCELVTSFTLTKPTLFRTDLPHQVVNFGNRVRRAISLRFEEDPWHLVGNDFENFE